MEGRRNIAGSAFEKEEREICPVGRREDGSADLFYGHGAAHRSCDPVRGMAGPERKSICGLYPRHSRGEEKERRSGEEGDPMERIDHGKS